MVNVVNRKSKTKEDIEHFRRLATASRPWSFYSKEKLKAIDDLGENPDPDTVANIIGGHGWTLINCENCYAYVEKAILVGECLGYDSRTALVCEECLKAALKELQETV